MDIIVKLVSHIPEPVKPIYGSFYPILYFNAEIYQLRINE